MGPTLSPPGSYRPQMGPMLDPWTLLLYYFIHSFVPNIEAKSVTPRDDHHWGQMWLTGNIWILWLVVGKADMLWRKQHFLKKIMNKNPTIGIINTRYRAGSQFCLLRPACQIWLEMGKNCGLVYRWTNRQAGLYMFKICNFWYLEVYCSSAKYSSFLCTYCKVRLH